MEKWIIPCNINYFDIQGAFTEYNVLDWKQSAKSIEVGDEVYIYVGVPISSILYRCKVLKTNIPKIEIDDSKYIINGDNFENYGNYMRLELIETYDEDKFSLDKLRAKGLSNTIQGPRRALGLLDDTASIIEGITTTELTGKDKEALVKIRVNQGYFRNLLLSRYNHCCLCDISLEPLLLASHIKPWSVSDDKEKLDADNGLLLCPVHDRLFDRGYISFDDNGAIIISEDISFEERTLLSINEDINICMTEKNKEYMKYHRGKIFKKNKQEK